MGGLRYPAWLSLPAVAWYLVFFVGPLAIMAVFSFSRREGFTDIVYDFNLENYDDLIDPLYGQVFTRTLGLAAIGTVVTLILGFPLAYYLARWAKHKTLLLLLVVVPFWTSILIRTYAWLIIFDPDFPVIGSLDLLYTTKAVYVGVVYTYLPLMILPLYAALERLDWSLVEAAEDLGDSPLRAFRRITLPLAAPGIVAGSLLVFIPLMGEYLNPVILGGDKTVYAGNLIGQQFLLSRDWPFGSAIAMVLIASMTVVVFIYSRAASRQEAYGG
jgi:spermidine/putrescine transport system permease protein